MKQYYAIRHSITKKWAASQTLKVDAFCDCKSGTMPWLFTHLTTAKKYIGDEIRAVKRREALRNMKYAQKQQVSERSELDMTIEFLMCLEVVEITPSFTVGPTLFRMMFNLEEI